MDRDELDLTFRPARPDDVEAALPLIHSSGPEAFDYMYCDGSTTAHDFLRYSFENGAGIFGHRVHTVAEVDGRVVGTGAFYAGSQYDWLSVGLVMQVLRFYGAIRFGSVARRMIHCMRLMPRIGWRAEYVADLGVAPDMRSHGIGRDLLTHQLEVARTKGRRTYAIDVATTNPRAQALYESFGFEFVSENRFGRNGEVPDTRRLEMRIAA